MIVSTMYEVTTVDPNLDPFAISVRPLLIRNCNIPPCFTPASTRMTMPQMIYDDRKQFCESISNIPIQPQPKPDEIESEIDQTNESQVYSDHFNRDFKSFHLPVPTGTVPPFFDINVQSKRYPHYMLDLPSTSMQVEEKIYFDAVMDPKLTKELPCCCMCNNQLVHPFYSSLKHKICPKCLSVGNLPPNSTTLDFMVIEDPSRTCGSWNLEETNKLLELIEELGDDWQTISERLKTHSPAECLIHFMRLPMYDPFYIADPNAVPEGEIPKENMIIPFMIAPDPIATYVEFLHILEKRLGNKAAEYSQKQIEQILSSKSGNMLFENIPDIMRNLLKLTGEEAGALAVDDFNSMLQTYHLFLRFLEKDKNHLFTTVEEAFKSFSINSQDDDE